MTEQHTYKINENGVIQNPKEINLYDGILIKTAYDGIDSWVYGVDISCKRHGKCSPVIFTDCKKYQTEKDAIENAKKEIIDYLIRNEENEISEKIKLQSDQITFF